MMVLTHTAAANSKQGRKARDHNTSFRRILQRMRRIAWLASLHREESNKEEIIVSFLGGACLHS